MISSFLKPAYPGLPETPMLDKLCWNALQSTHSINWCICYHLDNRSFPSTRPTSQEKVQSESRFQINSSILSIYPGAALRVLFHSIIYWSRRKKYRKRPSWFCISVQRLKIPLQNAHQNILKLQDAICAHSSIVTCLQESGTSSVDRTKIWSCTMQIFSANQKKPLFVLLD